MDLTSPIYTQFSAMWEEASQEEKDKFFDKIHNSDKKKAAKEKPKLQTVVADRHESESRPSQKDKEFDRIMKFGRTHPLRVRRGSTTTDNDREFTPPKETRPRYKYVKPEEEKKARQADMRRRMNASNVKETMDFTEFCNSFKDPLYEVLGKDNVMPKCPVGYKWNKMTMRCEPKGPKDSVSGPGGSSPYSGGNYTYNIIGSSGYDGGWAFEEKPTPGTEGG